MASIIVEAQGRLLDSHLEIQWYQVAKLQIRISMQIPVSKQEAQGPGKDPKDSKMRMHPSHCLLLEAEINRIKCLMEELWIQDLLQHLRMKLYLPQIAQANKWIINNRQRTDRDSRFQLLYPVKNKRTRTSSLWKYRLYSLARILPH